MGNVVGINIAIPLDRVFSCCWRQACAPKENFQSLQKEWEWLKAARNDVKKRINDEERQQRKRLEQVDQWLSRVEAIEVEVDKLITADVSKKTANKCLFGYCPKNCKTSYKLGKKIAAMQEELTTLSKLKPDVLTEKLLIAPGQARPTEPTLGLQSIFDEVWSYIEDEQEGIVGLYGMGGVGKTTLLTAVNNKLCNSTQRFDVVLWITVSKFPNLTEVQNIIGEKIGFNSNEWKNKSQEAKALDIYSVLEKKKYAVLLDDIWERLHITKLGLPPPNKNNKSKVVFTTRSQEVCGHMKAHKQIKVQCLEWGEAWDLFQENVGKEALNAHPEIPKLAEEVAKECGGLPLALITIGRAMACKTAPQDWHHAINVLKRYTSDFSGMGDDVFPCLKFSYDSLPNDIVRSCFLYCSLYPEDYLIRKEELIDQWICEGFLEKFDDFHKTRNEGHSYIGTLVHVSLLEECSPQEIKMHDVIRDMAIWIGCECGAMKNKFFVLARAGLTKAPKVTDLEGTERMSLMSNELVELTGAPKCPNLLTLFLNRNNGLKMIDGFLQSMRNLRVLDLSHNKQITRIPEEICKLVSLQYLNLSYSSLEELPMEFTKLVKLKYLNLGYTRIGKISEGVLSSFKELQMFNLDGCGLANQHWDGLPKTFVKELETLEYLSELGISISSDFALSEFLPSRKLISFTTALDLSNLMGSRYLDLLFFKEMIRLEKLTILHLYKLEKFIIGEGKATSSIVYQNSFSSLRVLFIFDCPNLKDLTWLASAPNIEDIIISFCCQMKTLVGGSEWDENAVGGRPVPFAKLQKLHFTLVPELESIYPTALPFPCFKEMTVITGCPKLKKLPFNSSSCRSGCGFTIKGYDEWCDGLEWEDEDTRLAFLPSFKPF